MAACREQPLHLVNGFIPARLFVFCKETRKKKVHLVNFSVIKEIQNLLLHSDVIDREMVLITRQLLQNAPQQMVHLIINSAPTATAPCTAKGTSSM